MEFPQAELWIFLYDMCDKVWLNYQKSPRKESPACSCEHKHSCRDEAITESMIHSRGEEAKEQRPRGQSHTYGLGVTLHEVTQLFPGHTSTQISKTALTRYRVAACRSRLLTDRSDVWAKRSLRRLQDRFLWRDTSETSSPCLSQRARGREPADLRGRGVCGFWTTTFWQRELLLLLLLEPLQDPDRLQPANTKSVRDTTLSQAADTKHRWSHAAPSSSGFSSEKTLCTPAADPMTCNRSTPKPRPPDRIRLDAARAAGKFPAEISPTQGEGKIVWRIETNKQP